MRVIKSFFIAFSMYSKIPVPQFAWKEEDMKYIFCFFPWIGALIGGCIYLWNYLCGVYHVGAICRTAMNTAIPLLITGGIHVDGFMDTIKIVCCGFFLSRCLCGISVVSFPLAKKDGMLYTFADSSHKKIVKGSLYLQSAVCIGVMLYLSVFAALLVTAAAVSFLVYYFYRSKKEFGGVTGDTAGWFGVLCEGCIVAVAALINIFI